MPRGPRPVVPGIPHHVIHRGNNRQVVFAEAEDYRYYLSCLQRAKTLCSCRLYAFVLMTNHVHLLLQPAAAGGLGRFMKRVAGRYTRYMNRRYHRTGTLWEGRFRSALVDGEGYLLAVSRYIEMNPVRAGMVSHPREYPWSSYVAHVEGKADRLVDWDPWYESLGREVRIRSKGYEEWMEGSIPKAEWEAIRLAVRRKGWVGSERFEKQITALLGRPVENRAPGRPRKSEK